LKRGSTVMPFGTVDSEAADMRKEVYVS
jgi:hypothetical protein